MEARLVGIIRLEKNGVRNDRLIACAKRMQGVAQNTDPFDDIDEFPKAMVKSLCRFLVDYSKEEGNEMTFEGVASRKKALGALKDGVKAFKAHKRSRAPQN